MFGLPDIAVDTLEEEADRVHKSLYTSVKRNEEHRYRFEPVLIKEKFKKSDNMHMWPAELPEECLGQIRFEASSATIYDINDPCTPHPNYPIPANSILLNVKYYRNEIGCDDIITAAHELVHWEIHRDYMRLLQFLDDRYKVMECKTVPIPLDNNMSPKEKASWYAEWQANELAIRVAMPKHLVEEAIAEYNNDESVHNPADIPFSGMYYQNMIYKLSWDFNVPKEVMKKRLRQLGYDYADGTLVTVDDCFYPPFTFPRGTLKENETFVIDRENYERLLHENSDFSELINSGRYVYLGYAICLRDPKYVTEEKVESLEPILSEYARENAHKCLLKFRFRNEKASNQSYYYSAFYLNKIPEYNEIVPESFELCEEDTGLDSTTVAQIKEYNETLDMLNSPSLSTLANTVVYYMKEKKKDENTLYKDAGLTLTALRKIYQGKTKKPEMKTVMGLCIGLELDNDECYDLFEKAGYNIREDTLQNRAYRYLFNNTFLGVKECNLILRLFKQEELPIHK
jgi:DNA-binding Xre family transcriptional regulator